MGKAIREIIRRRGIDPNTARTTSGSWCLTQTSTGSTRVRYFSEKRAPGGLNVGITESNMVGMAAGLASVGKIPFVNTFTVFLTTLGLCAARRSALTRSCRSSLPYAAACRRLRQSEPSRSRTSQSCGVTACLAILKWLGLGTPIGLRQLQGLISSLARHHCAFTLAIFNILLLSIPNYL